MPNKSQRRLCYLKRCALRPRIELLEDRLAPAAGDLDLTFNGTGTVRTSFANAYQSATDVAIDAHGRIVTVGWTRESGHERIAISRLLSNGLPDASFDQDGQKVLTYPDDENGFAPDSRATAVAIDPVDGDIVVVERGMGVFRLLADGRLDTSFGVDGIQTLSGEEFFGKAFDVAIDPFQNIFVVGVDETHNDPQFAVARLNARGQIQRAVTASSLLGNQLTAYRVAVRPTGEVVVAGVNQGDDIEPTVVVAQFTSNLDLDTNFGFSGMAGVRLHPAEVGLDPIKSLGLALQDNGKIVIAVTRDESPGEEYGDKNLALVRLEPNGDPDTSFGSFGLISTDLYDHSIDEANDVVVASDGSIYVAGTWSFEFAVTKFTPAGVLDLSFGNSLGFLTTFGGHPANGANALAVQANGELVAAGTAFHFDPQTAATELHFAVARFLTNEGERLTIEPEQYVNDAGDQVPITVRLFVDGRPGPALRRVDFFARRDGVLVYSKSIQTDSEGKAVFVYTNHSAGMDELEGVLHDTGLQRTGHKIWTAKNGFKAVMQVMGGSPRDSADDPSVDTVRTVGTYVVKAVVLKDGQPQNGVVLSLRVKALDRPEDVNPIRTFTTASIDINENGEIDPGEVGVALLDGYTRGTESRDEVVAWINADADPEPSAAEICGSYRLDFVGGKPVVVLHENDENDVFGAPTTNNTLRVLAESEATVNIRLLRDIGFRGIQPDKYAGNPADDGVDLTWTVESGPNAGKTGVLTTKLGDISFTLPAAHSGVDDVIRVIGTVQTHLEPDQDGHFEWHYEQLNQTVTIDWAGAPSYDLGLAWYGWFEFGNSWSAPTGITKVFGALVTSEDGHGINGVPVVLRHDSGPNGGPAEDRYFGMTSQKFIGLPFPSNHDGIAEMPLFLSTDPQPGVDVYQLIVNGIERDRMTVTWLPAQVIRKSDTPQTVTVDNSPFGPESFDFTFSKITHSGRVAIGGISDSSQRQPPPKYKLLTGAGETIYDLSTILASYQGPIDISIHLPASFAGATDLIGFFHWENGQWVDRLTSARNVRDGNGQLVEVIVTCRVDSLSPFALFERIKPPAPLVESVVINDGSSARATISKITVTFSHEVAFAAGAFELRPQKGASVPLNVTTSVVNEKAVAVLQIVGKPVKNSKLRLLFRGAKILDDFAQALDGNRDGTGGDDHGIDFAGASFIDQDGDSYTVNLKGPGQAFVTQHDPDVDGRGPILQITLQGTDPAKSTLTIAVVKARLGDGRVTIHDIHGTGLKSLTAAATDLVTGEINLGGYLGTLVIGDIRNGADVFLPAGAALQTTSITAHVIGAGSEFVIGAPIASFTAAAVGDVKLTARAITSLSIKGDAKAKIRGDFLADLTLNGPPLPGKVALGSATIGGNIADAVWSIAGDIGRLTVNGATMNWLLDADAVTQSATLGEVTQARFNIERQVKALSAATLINSVLFAGFQPTNEQQPLAGGVFSPDGNVESFKVNGKKGLASPAFAGSTVAAAKFGAVSVASLATANGGVAFGVLADISIGNVSVKAPAWMFDKTKPTPQGLGDFQVVIV